jgi:hypothetical protein
MELWSPQLNTGVHHMDDAFLIWRFKVRVVTAWEV